MGQLLLLTLQLSRGLVVVGIRGLTESGGIDGDDMARLKRRGTAAASGESPVMAIMLLAVGVATAAATLLLPVAGRRLRTLVVQFVAVVMVAAFLAHEVVEKRRERLDVRAGRCCCSCCCC